MLVPIWFALQPLVQGENCPAPVDVEARVRVILHLAPEQELREGFIVERHEAGLYVELRGADATLIGQRTLPTAGSCDELAQAAAVVLSTWLSDVHPDFAGVLPDREPEPVAAPEPAATPEPPVASPTPSPHIKPQIPPPSAPARSTPRRWDLALGVGADLTGGRFAVAVPAMLGYVPIDTGFGVRAMAIATPSRQAPLGPGQVSWRRWPLGAGPTWSAASSSVAWEASPGVLLSWLHVAGKNFDHTLRHDAASWGGYLNLRVSSRGPHWGLFGLANAQFYPVRADVYATGVQGGWPVPRLTLALAVGVDFSP